MSITKKEIQKVSAYRAQEYNDYVMALNNHDDLEELLIYMIKNGKKERTRRTYARYCVERRKFENKMIVYGEWYKQ